MTRDTRHDELDALRATVAQLAAKVQALEDRFELMQLVAQYGPAADSGDGSAVAALWTDDGAFDAVPNRRMRGRAEIAGMIDGAGHQSLVQGGCAHVLTVPHIALDGDRATGRSYALNLRWDAPSERFWVARVSANSWRWERTAEGWRIAERVNAVLDGTPAHRAVFSNTAASAREAK